MIIPPTCRMLIAQGTFSMLVMVEMADQTALWCARGQRMMATRVRMFMYFTAKEKRMTKGTLVQFYASLEPGLSIPDFVS